jgi:hypothetical protein
LGTNLEYLPSNSFSRCWATLAAAS